MGEEEVYRNGTDLEDVPDNPLYPSGITTQWSLISLTKTLPISDYTVDMEV